MLRAVMQKLRQWIFWLKDHLIAYGLAAALVARTILVVVLGLVIGGSAAFLLLSPRDLGLPKWVSASERYTPKDDFSNIEERYLGLLKRHLTRYDGTVTRAIGGDWPEDAETMIGMARIDQLHEAIKDVLRRDVPGDLIECGAWRGGATIFMRAALEAYGDTSRRVWVADSFQGLPKPDPSKYPADRGDNHWKFEDLAVTEGQVKANFARYGLLDERVQFLVGFFRDTLPKAPIEQLAILRVDADMYEGTMQSLEYLYDKVSPGGYVIVDDYGALDGCRFAVEEFRQQKRITSPIQHIDWTGVYWIK